jgi:hypothetical protein
LTLWVVQFAVTVIEITYEGTLIDKVAFSLLKQFTVAMVVPFFETSFIDFHSVPHLSTLYKQPIFEGSFKIAVRTDTKRFKPSRTIVFIVPEYACILDPIMNEVLAKATKLIINEISFESMCNVTIYIKSAFTMFLHVFNVTLVFQIAICII